MDSLFLTRDRPDRYLSHVKSSKPYTNLRTLDVQRYIFVDDLILMAKQRFKIVAEIILRKFPLMYGTLESPTKTYTFKSIQRLRSFSSQVKTSIPSSNIHLPNQSHRYGSASL